MPLFGDKDHSNDPLLESQAEQFHFGTEQDKKIILEKMQREYPSPESAIDDYDRGYIPEAHLAIRFTPEEVAYIKKEKRDRDEEDKPEDSGSYL